MRVPVADEHVRDGRAALVIAVLVLTVSGVPLVLMPIGLMVGAMAFDAPGSSTSVWPYFVVATVLAYPVAWVAAVLGTRWLRRRRRYTESLLLALLPLLTATPLVIVGPIMHGGASGPVKARDVYADGARAWVTASSERERDGWLASVDLTNPRAPKQERAMPLTLTGSTSTSSTMPSWAILGVSAGAVFLADPRRDVRVIDMVSGSTLARPQDDVSGGAVAGGRLFVAASGGLSVYDAAEPSALPAVAHLAMNAAAVAAVSGARAVVVVAPVSLGRSPELCAFDVDERAHLKRRGRWRYPPGVGHSGLAVAGDLAVVLLSDRTLRLVDFSDPDRPTETGRLTLPARTQRLAVRGSIAAVAGMDASRSVWLVNLADPTRPVVAGTLGPFEAEPALAFAGDRLLVAAGRVLTATDVSDPAAPRASGRVELQGELQAVH